jgi:hypothetical protein
MPNSRKKPSTQTHFYRPCFACGRTIVSAKDGKTKMMEFSDPPSDATCWTTRGNYGSTLFDRPSQWCNERLEITVCDECVRKGMLDGRVLIFRKDEGAPVQVKYYRNEGDGFPEPANPRPDHLVPGTFVDPLLTNPRSRKRAPGRTGGTADGSKPKARPTART